VAYNEAKSNVAKSNFRAVRELTEDELDTVNGGFWGGFYITRGTNQDKLGNFETQDLLSRY